MWFTLAFLPSPPSPLHDLSIPHTDNHLFEFLQQLDKTSLTSRPSAIRLPKLVIHSTTTRLLPVEIHKIKPVAPDSEHSPELNNKETPTYQGHVSHFPEAEESS
jgi:hypothetical protein